MRLFHGGWRLKKSRLRETTEQLPNPAAGWYHIYQFPLEVPVEQLQPQWLLEPGESLAFLLVNIGAFQRKELNREAQENLSRGLEFFCRSGKDLIVRAAYDCEGRGVQSEPAQFERVVQHLRQLTQVLAGFRDRIFVFQGMLLGSWGEMHSSRFLTKPRMKTLLAELEELEGPFLAVRRPMFYRMLRSQGTEETRLGLFDDAIFATDTDMGTFGWLSREQAGWEGPWLPEEELDFEDALCRLVPQGGEALLPQLGQLTLRQAAQRLTRMHITYLNAQYDPALLQLWKQQRWEGGLWNGMDGLSYIGRHLGYRFCLRDAALRMEAGQLTVCVTVENVGFAPIYQPCEGQLIQVTQAGQTLQIPMKGTLLGLTRGTRILTAQGLSREKSRIYLRMLRLSDGREIPFATRSDQQPQADEASGLFLGSLE